MKKIALIILYCCLSLQLFGQDFDKKISSVCDSIGRKIISSKKQIVAISDFVNINGSTTQLGVFLSNEISAELSNLTDNQKRFKVLERSKLDQIYQEKKLVTTSDGSKEARELGKLELVDVLIFATITDLIDSYRIAIKLLETRNGDALSSVRFSLFKTPALENLNKDNIKSLGIPIKNLIAQDQSYKLPENETNKREAAIKGDFCFTLTSNYYPPQAAKITIYKVNSKEVEKIVNVSPDAPSCVYELQAGIHTVSINWDRSTKDPEIREIKVKAGQSSTINFRYQ